MHLRKRNIAEMKRRVLAQTLFFLSLTTVNITLMSKLASVGCTNSFSHWKAQETLMRMKNENRLLESPSNVEHGKKVIQNIFHEELLCMG